MTDDSIEPEILINGLTKIHRMGESDIHALRGINLAVSRGQFVGVVGVSGSGKSTLLHLVGGLDFPNSGTIRVAGRDICQMTRRQRTLFRRSTVGFVFQSFFLVPTLTAEQNVQLALTLQGSYGAERETLATEALRQVGLSDRAWHKPGQLSGGEQQRVAVARAIVHRPRLLLADEPTGNLDNDTARRLMDLIDTIRRESATTVVLVTHDEDMVSQYCDRLVRIRDGRFVDAGGPTVPRTGH